MFEAYTEAARRAIFLGRFEAGRVASSSLEVEHIVVGILQADLRLNARLFKSQEQLDNMRRRLMEQTPGNPTPAATSVDIPLSRLSRRVLAYATAEAERLNHKYIGCEHLLLGILRENTSLAATILRESEITLAKLDECAEQGKVPPPTDSPKIEGVRNLVAESREADQHLIGRQRELGQIIQILSRRTKNNVVLIGEPGVGKDSLVRGLAKRISEGNVPQDLMDSQILQIEVLELKQKLVELSQHGGPIFYVRGLFDLRPGMSALTACLKAGKLQVIATATPLAFRLAMERDDELARNFEAVRVLPPTEEEALQILDKAKLAFESFHSVSISPEAIQMAVSASARFLSQRALPDRALDLIDDAGARVKLRADVWPPELTGRSRHLRSLVQAMERAIAKHDFEQAKRLAEEEKMERAKFESMREELKFHPPTKTVTADDVIEVVAARVSISADAVRSALALSLAADAEAEARNEIGARVPPGRRDWVDGLVSYLTDCSKEDGDRLLDAIRSAKAKLPGKA